MQTRGILVTGTDTGVGKTCVASLIARECCERGLTVGAYKPVCSGADLDSERRPVWGDVETLFQSIGGKHERDSICPQRFAAAVAPPAAAQLEGKTVDNGLLRSGARRWNGRVEMLVVEGAGGLLCPLSDSATVADLAADLKFPLIIVVRLGLGAINHTLLTVEVARSRGLPLAGIILNEVEPPDVDADDRNERAEIEQRSQMPILGLMRHKQPDRLLRDDTEDKIDWLALSLPMSHGLHD